METRRISLQVVTVKPSART